MAEPRVSLVAPAHNEEANVERLVDEVGRIGPVLARRLGGSDGDFEFVLVDDGSTDSTRARAEAQMPARPWLRVVAMTRTPPGRGGGQSAAFHAGFRACRSPIIAVLDADLQNDPADLAPMLDLMLREGADLVQGDRSRNRRDTFVRRAGSAVGRFFRRIILGDAVRDTGCSLRLMRREAAVRLPLEFRGMHRFIPAMVRQMGGKVVEMPVSHRPRVAGETKYGMGIVQRAWPGLVDCFAVRWMRSRRTPTDCVEVSGAAPAPDAHGVPAGGKAMPMDKVGAPR